MCWDIDDWINPAVRRCCDCSIERVDVQERIGRRSGLKVCLNNRMALITRHRKIRGSFSRTTKVKRTHPLGSKMIRPSIGILQTLYLLFQMWRRTQ